MHRYGVGHGVGHGVAHGVEYGVGCGVPRRLQKQHRRGEGGLLRGAPRRRLEALRDGQRARSEQPVQHLLARWVAASGTRGLREADVVLGRKGRHTK